jgi:hypothetical protein
VSLRARNLVSRGKGSNTRLKEEKKNRKSQRQYPSIDAKRPESKANPHKKKKKKKKNQIIQWRLATQWTRCRIARNAQFPMQMQAMHETF